MTVTEFLQAHHVLGLTIGLSTFLTIGVFHPIVIKSEYYFGVRCWWWFLLVGIVCLTLSAVVCDVLWSTMLGVVGFSCFWSIKEIFEQEERVKKGWFPRNPKRKYRFDKE